MDGHIVVRASIFGGETASTVLLVEREVFSSTADILADECGRRVKDKQIVGGYKKRARRSVRFVGLVIYSCISTQPKQIWS